MNYILNSKAKAVFAYAGVLFLFLASMVLVSPHNAFAGLYAGGDGLTENTAYQITTCQELQNINANPGSFFKIMNDIHCGGAGTSGGNDTTTWNSGAGFAPISGFTGMLESASGSYTIYGLYINLPTTDSVGLFSDSTGATIRNINFNANSAGSITGHNIVGIVVGYAQASVITNITSNEAVNGSHQYIGGLAGNVNIDSSSNPSTFSHSSSTGTISVSTTDGSLVENIGGIAGMMYGVNLNEGADHLTYNGTISVQAPDSRVIDVGGIAGTISTSIATNDTAGAATSITVVADDVNSGGISYVGSLFGLFTGNTNTTSALHALAGSTIHLTIGQDEQLYGVGGLMGELDHSSLGSSDAATAIVIDEMTGSDSFGGYVGGLVGYTSAVTIHDSYSTGSIDVTQSDNNLHYVGGLVGSSENNTSTVWDHNYSTENITLHCTVNDYCSYIGGLYGNFLNAGISRSFASGTVTVNQGDNSAGQNVAMQYIGGIAGATQDSPLTNSFFSGNLVLNGYNAAEYVGGIVGSFQEFSTVGLTAQNLYASGPITYTDLSGTHKQIVALGGILGQVLDFATPASTLFTNDFVTSAFSTSSGTEANGNDAGMFGQVITSGSLPTITNDLWDSTSTHESYCYTYNGSGGTTGCTAVSGSTTFKGSTANPPFNNGTQQWDFTTPVWDVHSTSYPTLDGLLNPFVSGATVPGAPTGLSAVAQNAAVALSWTAPASNGGSAITDYLVQYKVNGAGSWSTFADGTSTTPSATVTGLTNNTTYVFQVSAVNSIGTSAPSATASATPVPPAPAITGVGVSSIGQTTAAIAWTTDQNSDSQVSYGTVMGTHSTSTAVTDSGTPVTSHTVNLTGLTPATTYYYVVTSSDGSSATSSENSFTTVGIASGGGGGGGGNGATNGGGAGAPSQPSSEVSPHADGTLVLDGSTIYLVQNSKLVGFRDPAEYKSYGYAFSQAVPINSNDRTLPMDSTTVLKAMPGSLVLDTTDNRTVYIIGKDYTKMGFTTPKAFAALGYSYAHLQKINLKDYPVGAVITSATAVHPDGTLIKKGQTVWQILGGQKHGFATYQTFQSYGFVDSQIINATPGDLALPTGDLIKFRDGTLVVDNGIFYIISDGFKVPFVSEADLENQGYSLANLIEANLLDYQTRP